MKVLVTGATGFFGAHVVRALLTAGMRVAVLRRQNSNVSRLRALTSLTEDIEDVVCDLRSQSEVRAALFSIKPDAVLHAAAYGVDFAQNDIETIVGSNISATAYLIHAASATNVQKFLHIGTCFEYGEHDGSIPEDAPLRPLSLYGSVKAAASVLALGMGLNLGLPLCVTRIFGMYGPLEGSHKFIPSVLAAAALGSVLPCSPGEQLRDYTYVGDVCDACVRILAGAFPKNQVINLGSGHAITIRMLAEAAAQVASVSPSFLKWGALPYRPNEVMRIEADPAKARQLLGWIAKTSLQDGLKETFSWEAKRSDLKLPGATV